jgi:hypothetical protein
LLRSNRRKRQTNDPCRERNSAAVSNTIHPSPQDTWIPVSINQK